MKYATVKVIKEVTGMLEGVERTWRVERRQDGGKRPTWVFVTPWGTSFEKSTKGDAMAQINMVERNL